ncbi:MAG: hypothetical protein EOP06_26820, partial [Proteobacteria bacterium]
MSKGRVTLRFLSKRRQRKSGASQIVRHFITSTCGCKGTSPYTFQTFMPSRAPQPAPSQSSHYFSRDIAPFSPSQLQRAHSISVGFESAELQFLTGQGLFSRDEFDEGSRLLLETMYKYGEFPDSTRFCDLGCGWGGVGTFWAKLHPEHQVLALDVNPRAAQLTHLNFERNALPNAA